VARVYRELEAAGMVVTKGRHGTLVANLSLAAHRADPADPMAPLAASLALEAHQRGVGVDQLVELVRRSFRDLNQEARPT
jgi:DNA-binding transcriptional regulator YhcF (GntR family)